MTEWPCVGQTPSNATTACYTRLASDEISRIRHLVALIGSASPSARFGGRAMRPTSRHSFVIQ